MMLTNFLRVLVILLGFSYVLSVSAIPATRTQSLNCEDASILASVAQPQDAIDVKEGLKERRMDLETQDYGGTGANRDHNPKSPGMVDVQNIH